MAGALEGGAPARPRATRGRKVLFALVPVVVLVLGAEGVMRFSEWRKGRRERPWDVPVLSTTGGVAITGERTAGGVVWHLDPRLLWRFAPNQKNERGAINGQGFRGADWADPKPAGVRRVFVLGGSVAYGWGVAGDDATIPARLQRALGAGFEVLNAGVIAYDSTQELILLETELLARAPDAVVLLDGWNDFLYAGLTPPGEEIRPITFRELEAVLVRSQEAVGPALRLSALWRRLERRRPQSEQGPYGEHPRGVPTYRRNLELVARIGAAYGVRVVLAVQPEIAQRAGELPAEWATRIEQQMGPTYLPYARAHYPRYVAAAKEVAAANGAGFVEGTRALEGLQVEAFTDACHLTGEANEALAQRIAEELRR